MLNFDKLMIRKSKPSEDTRKRDIPTGLIPKSYLSEFTVIPIYANSPIA